MYIHIPFCRSKCHYCNFVSVASVKYQDDYVRALLKEITLQKSFFNQNDEIETIYFGGGTPSLLKIGQIEEILEVLSGQFKISSDAEITLEMNPDDAVDSFLSELFHLGFNRLSIGTQSFHDEELKFLGRKHDALTAYQSVVFAREAGFSNISIDLIFGLPQSFSKDPSLNIEKILALDVEHVSAYSLTLEPDTIMSHLVSGGKIPAPDDNLAAEQFRFYMSHLKQAGYEHYEISNYAKPGFRSRHNSAYWKNQPYLGLGAGAHSYDLKNRFWNTSLITEYISQMNSELPKRESETLTLTDKYNEYIITSIRTSEGTDPELIHREFGENFSAFLSKNIQNFISKGYVVRGKTGMCLTDEGKLWADAIAVKLMM